MSSMLRASYLLVPILLVSPFSMAQNAALCTPDGQTGGTRFSHGYPGPLVDDGNGHKTLDATGGLNYAGGNLKVWGTYITLTDIDDSGASVTVEWRIQRPEGTLHASTWVEILSNEGSLGLCQIGRWSCSAANIDAGSETCWIKGSKAFARANSAKVWAGGRYY